MAVTTNEVTLENVIRISQNENQYDFIIVGSGMGGGTLARMLVQEHGKSVLLIERGGIRFNTHCLNTARPHWHHEARSGPSQDNDIVYRAVKEQIPVAGGNSREYAGGPVYCLGGRSNVWGLYSPSLQSGWTRENFPREVAKGLTMVVNGCNAFERAYQLVTSSETARHDAPYPEGVTANYEYYDGKKAALGRETGLNFSFAPLAAEFVSPNQSTDQLYSFPAGAYSTVDWLLDRIYNNDTRLTVLLGAEVLTVNPRLDTPNDRRIDSITVRQKETVGEIRTTSAKAVILCAGTVDTAHIAIRSGMQKNDHSNVGKGLTDHSIWGTRFKIVPDQGESLSPLKLQAWWDLPSASPSCSCACEGTCDESCRCTRTEHRCDCGCGRPRCCCLNSCQGMQPRKNRQMEEVRCEGDPVLINICVNANTFLGHSLERMFPLQCLNQRGQSLPQERTENTRTNTVNVTFEFASKLEDKNRVLNKGQPAPVLDISESDENSGCYEAMKHMTRNIMKALQPELFNGRSSVDERRIRLSRAEFGAVAHEVGTMRMGTQDDAAAVVDENLKVKDWKGLYVCDLSVFPASPAANPSLTLVALAMRLANYLVEKSG